MTANLGMYKALTRDAKSSLVCGSRFKRRRSWRNFAVMSTVTVAVCLPSALLAAMPPAPVQGCPSQEETGTLLGKASALMEQSRYQEAGDSLKPLAGLPCDARVNLLLAASFEMSGD